MYTKH